MLGPNLLILFPSKSSIISFLADPQSSGKEEISLFATLSSVSLGISSNSLDITRNPLFDRSRVCTELLDIAASSKAVIQLYERFRVFSLGNPHKEHGTDLNLLWDRSTVVSLFIGEKQSAMF